MKTVLKIKGMMCAHCTSRVQKALQSVDGVEKVTISLEEQTATVITDEVAREQLIEAVTDAGYEVVEVIEH
jgi:Cu+-exporting ATPase